LKRLVEKAARLSKTWFCDFQSRKSASHSGILSCAPVSDSVDHHQSTWLGIRRGRSSTLLTTLKIAVLAPMPSARGLTAIAVPGFFAASECHAPQVLLFPRSRFVRSAEVHAPELALTQPDKAARGFFRGCTYGKQLSVAIIEMLGQLLDDLRLARGFEPQVAQPLSYCILPVRHLYLSILDFGLGKFGFEGRLPLPQSKI
jgi:hypothetical protein